MESGFERCSFHGSDTLDLGEVSKLRKHKQKLEDTEESEESDSEDTPARTTRSLSMSVREVTNLDIYSYILCIRSAVCKKHNLKLNYTPIQIWIIRY